MFKKVLAIAPHTDDVELGAGATLAHFVSEGVDLHVAVFSTARDSLPEGHDPDTLTKEFREAMAILGVPEENISVFNFPVRRLSYFRQDVLEILVQLRDKIKPDCVLVPSTSDLHQDHQVLSSEGLRAFKYVTMFGYELPWNHINFSAQTFVRVTSQEMDIKIAMLSCYKSQIIQNKKYFDPSFIRSLAVVRGVQINGEFAEAFEVLRFVI